MPDRSHLSIGEVLSLLREEFPDVTISKIRFLESQGLVDPERTPSGYRKFYDHDVDRLRWILRQQREHFLPLKVIRGRLTEQEGAEPAEGPLSEEEAGAVADEAESSQAGGAPAPSTAARREGAAVATAAPSPSGHPTEEAQPTRPVGEERPPSNGPGRATPPTPSLFAALHADQPRADRPETAPPTPAPAQEPAPVGRAGYEEEPDTYTAEEMARAVGAEATLVHELKQYGLVTPHAVVAGVPYYDAAALAVARAAADFARHGVEARHLRIWKNAADREADLFQQVVLPLLRQRNPQARRQALDTLAELTAAGAALRAALVERAVRDIR
ncbi:MAG TPA: MerR family transcriptional regulator [Acidimicrobiales bacterium]|nr:MerR family transcriptional regulator [Acidimicrobiales bacterium]